MNVLRMDHKTHLKFWDVSAMATECHNVNYVHFAKGYTHYPKGILLGNISERLRLGKKNVIGNYAEQHAGNSYMNRVHENDIHKFYFTETVRLRSRTMEVFPSCMMKIA